MAETITLESGQQIPNFKDRSFCMILYPERNPNHVTAMEKIRAGYQYLAINHSEDSTEDGAPKGPHIHLILKVKHPRYVSALSKELGIEPKLFRKLESFDGYARYMLHLDEPDKHQYEFDDLEGPLKDLAEKAILGKETEDERIVRLLDLLDSIDCVIDMRAWTRIVCAAGLYGDSRRAGYTMRVWLEEHNREVIQRAMD